MKRIYPDSIALCHRNAGSPQSHQTADHVFSRLQNNEIAHAGMIDNTNKKDRRK
jgi:hypothetical protein